MQQTGLKVMDTESGWEERWMWSASRSERVSCNYNDMPQIIHNMSKQGDGMGWKIVIELVHFRTE